MKERNFLDLKSLSWKEGKKTATLSNGMTFNSWDSAKQYAFEENRKHLKDIADPIQKRLAEEILALRHDYGDVIFGTLEELNPVKELNKLLDKLRWKKQCIYQSINFKNEIKDHLYIGIFSDNIKEKALESFDDGNFLSPLAHHFFDLFEEGNCYYDFWECGSEDFSLFFGIHKTVYKEKMQEVRNWIKDKGLEDIVSFKEKEIT